MHQAAQSSCKVILISRRAYIIPLAIADPTTPEDEVKKRKNHMVKMDYALGNVFSMQNYFNFSSSLYHFIRNCRFNYTRKWSEKTKKSHNENELYTRQRF